MLGSSCLAGKKGYAFTMDIAIYKAVESNEPEVLKQLIKRGADVNEFYQDLSLISAKSILHICCEKGRFDCVKILLENGANPAICDTWYQTPLMYCMLTQYYEIAELMLAYSPEVIDIGDKYGKSALHIAVQVGSVECVKVMLQMRDLYEYRKIREVMEEYVPKLKMGSIRQKPKPFKERVDLPKSPSQKELADRMAGDIHRHAASKHLTVSLASLEIYKNDLTKKVKLLDVKLSFSYQENFTTQTVRFDKQLVRNGKKWTWLDENGSKKIVTFPYLPGDRVNLNVGIFIHKTKKHGLFGKETITTQAGTVAECIVLARNNGVGMGLPLGQSITQDFRLNFDLNGRGHKLTMKLKLELKNEKKGPPILWLRPMSSDKRFRSHKSAFELLQELPPKEKDEDARVKLFVYNNQRLVNYQKAPVLDCRSVRPAATESEIPTGIEIRQSLGSHLTAFLVPVVKTIDKENFRYRLAILVVTAEGPHCLCSAKWKSADKFDYKIHMYKTGETFGQRVKWASKDFLDISYAILNSTGHQLTLKTESKTPIEDVCIGLSLKFLVRWSNEPLPWRQANIDDMMDVHKILKSRYNNVGVTISDCEYKSIMSHMKELPWFLQQHDLMVFSDVEECLCCENMAENRKMTLVRKSSDGSYDELETKPRGDVNIENEVDDDEDDVDGDTATVSSKPKFDVNWDDFTTSGFVDERSRSEFTGNGSWIDSVM